MFFLYYLKRAMAALYVPDAGGETIRMLDVGNAILPVFFKSGKEIQDIFNKIPAYKFRNDDIMLCTFSKTGN